jgi:hypothetical protein
MLLTSSALLTGGLVLLVADEAARDGDGYITSSTVSVESPGSAVLTEEIVIDNDSVVVDLPERLVGTVKVAASSERGDVFVGIGESEDVDVYLDGVARSIMRDPTGNDGSPTYDVIEGDAPTTSPDSEDFWLQGCTSPREFRLSFRSRCPSASRRHASSRSYIPRRPIGCTTSSYEISPRSTTRYPAGWPRAGPLPTGPTTHRGATLCTAPQGARRVD